jgi:hypothetical protein
MARSHSIGSLASERLFRSALAPPGDAPSLGWLEAARSAALTGFKMRFLLRLFSLFANWLAILLRPQSDEPERNREPSLLVPEDLVSRFIYSRNHFRKSDNSPKPGAFSPSPHDTLSVAHTTALGDGEIWGIARLTLTTEPGRDKVHARADIIVQALLERRLVVLRDDQGFERHTSVAGWPKADTPDNAKELIKEICLQLSQDSRVRGVAPALPITHQTS